jgi:hypothetical protein
MLTIAVASAGITAAAISIQNSFFHPSSPLNLIIF